jgi:hypothetical protein
MVLPPQVIQAFSDLGDGQRYGGPESAMLRVHRVMGTGPLFSVVEHVGDLTHRMTQSARWKGANAWILAGGLDVVEKVDLALQKLAGKRVVQYGLEREIEEALRWRAANHFDISYAEMRRMSDEALAKYASEHAKLPVYNHAQYLARGAAVAVGTQDFPKAIAYLKGLKALLKTRDMWSGAALDYRLDEQGLVLSYPWPRHLRAVPKPQRRNL